MVKNLERRALIDAFGAVSDDFASGPVKLRISFARPVTDLRNERTGRTLGAGRAFEDDFTPWEANVYTYSP